VVELIPRSERVLAVLLILAGREPAMTAQVLVEARNKLADTVEQIDKLWGRSIVNGDDRLSLSTSL
jgi:hypothetical protein